MSEYRFDQIAIVSTEKKKPTDADKENYIGLEHLSPDTFDVVDYGSEVAPKGEKLVMRKGDVLFGKRRAYQKKVGIAPCDGIFSAHGMVLRPNEEVIDARFFPFFIKSDAFLDEAIRISVGSLSPTVNWRDLRELRFNLPPIERQKELADLLWAGEDLRSTYRRLLDACGEQVKSRFIELLESGDYPRVQIGDLCELIVSGSTPSGNRIHEEKCSDSVPFLKVYNLTVKGCMAFDEQPQFVDLETHIGQLSRSIAKPGDVLMNIVGPPMGKFAIVPDTYPEWNMNQAIVLLRPSKRIKAQYLLGSLMSAESIATIERMSAGVRQQNLNVSKVRAMTIPLAPMSVQEDFCSFAQQVDKSEFALKQAIEGVSATMAAILNQELGMSDVQ